VDFDIGPDESSPVLVPGRVKAECNLEATRSVIGVKAME
jgi:hypothetical protein